MPGGASTAAVTAHGSTRWRFGKLTSKVRLSGIGPHHRPCCRIARWHSSRSIKARNFFSCSPTLDIPVRSSLDTITIKSYCILQFANLNKMVQVSTTACAVVALLLIGGSLDVSSARELRGEWGYKNSINFYFRVILGQNICLKA